MLNRLSGVRCLSHGCGRRWPASVLRSAWLGWKRLRSGRASTKKPAIARKPFSFHGAGGGARTHTLLRAADFESINHPLIDQGKHTRTLSIGEYTLGILSRDTDGVVTGHHLNPNCRHRPVFDYAESRALHG